MLTTADLAEIRERHTASPFTPRLSAHSVTEWWETANDCTVPPAQCTSCSTEWPCDAARLLDHVAALEAQLGAGHSTGCLIPSTREETRITFDPDDYPLL